MHSLQKVIHEDNEDASRPAARNLNLPNHSKQHMHMAVFGPSLHQGSTGSRKNLFFKLSLLILTVLAIAFHSSNLFCCFFTLPWTNSVAPYFCIQTTHSPQFLDSLRRRAQGQLWNLFTVVNSQYQPSWQKNKSSYLIHIFSAPAPLNLLFPSSIFCFQFLVPFSLFSLRASNLNNSNTADYKSYEVHLRVTLNEYVL